MRMLEALARLEAAPVRGAPHHGHELTQIPVDSPNALQQRVPQALRLCAGVVVDPSHNRSST